MKKHTTSPGPVILFVVLGLALVGSLVATWLSTEPAATPEPGIGAPVPVPPPDEALPPIVLQPSDDPPIDRERYEAALFEVTCARARIEDPRLRRETIDAIWARYDWDEDSFTRAQQLMKDDSQTIEKLRVQMTECTQELAASLSPQYVPVSDLRWRPGRYVDDEVRGSDLVGATLRITLDEQGQLTASFQGKRDDKGFHIPLRGEINHHNGKFIISGSRGPHNARVAGRFKDGQLVGGIQGVIHKQGYRVSFTARDGSVGAPRQPAPIDDVGQARAFSDQAITGADLEKGQLLLKVQADGTTIVGRFQGKRDGRGFSIPLKGTIEQGQVTAAGRRGPNEVRLTGSYTSDGIDGALQGLINKEGYRVSFKAQ